MAKILIVEDDLDLAQRLADWLQFEKYTVDIVNDGVTGLEYLAKFEYDLAILDWNLPGMDGVDVCRAYRDTGGAARVLMLTSRNRADEIELGLDTGADDYVTKPFVVQEVSARIRALLRRPSVVQASVLRSGDLSIDCNSRRVFQQNAEIKLLPKEFALLEFFVRNPNKVFSPEEILDRVWSSEAESSSETVYTYVKTLRKKINDADQTMITTIRGQGYRWDLQ